MAIDTSTGSGHSDTDEVSVAATDDSDIAFTPLAKRLMWIEEQANVALLVKGLVIVCVLLVVADLIAHRHSYWSLEAWIGFYAFAGFVAFTLIVLSAKQLRRLIKRPEDYYATDAVDSEQYPESGLDRKLAPRVNRTTEAQSAKAGETFE